MRQRFETDMGLGWNWIARTAGRVEAQLYVSTMILCAMGKALRPSTWVYPVRNRLARQILFAGVEAVPFTLVVAALMGGIVFSQCLNWLQYTGELDLLGRMVGRLLFGIVAPFLSTFLVMGASASAITTELATMKTSGEVKLLEGLGVNVFQYLVVPRMVGLAVCVFGLSLIFACVSVLASGVGFVFFGGSVQDPAPFFRTVFESLQGMDFVSLALLTVLPGLVMGALCCYEGLRVGGAPTEVPQAVSRAILRSISGTVVVTALVILFTYYG